MFLPKSSTKIETPSGSGTKQYTDFRLQVKPVRNLRNAVEAFSDTQFNPNGTGVLAVTNAGFSITVHEVMKRGGVEDDYFGYLCLYADNLVQFECNNPIRRIVSLSAVLVLLNDAQDDDTVTIYCQHDSQLLSFEFTSPVLGNPAGSPLVVGIDKVDAVDSFYEDFPDITYGLVVVTPVSVLQEMITEILEEEPINRPIDITLNIKRTTLRAQVGSYSLETPAEVLEVWWTWLFWEPLIHATLVSDKCSLYVVTEPCYHIMLKFNFGGVGDLIFLKEEYIAYDDEHELPCLGHYYPITGNKIEL